MTEVNKIATNQGIMTKEKNGNRASIISRVIFYFV